MRSNNHKTNRNRNGNNRSSGNRRGNVSRQSYDSNGPGVRIRGSATQIFEKYMSLGRDAQGTGDRVLAESFYQYAEHYYRIVNTDNESRRVKQQARDTTRIAGFAAATDSSEELKPEELGAGEVEITVMQAKSNENDVDDNGQTQALQKSSQTLELDFSAAENHENLNGAQPQKTRKNGPKSNESEIDAADENQTLSNTADTDVAMLHSALPSGFAQGKALKSKFTIKDRAKRSRARKTLPSTSEVV